MAVILSPEVKKDLTAVADFMEAHLNQVDMHSWITIRSSEDKSGQISCNTTGCIAGHIAMHYGYSADLLDSMCRMSNCFYVPTGAKNPSYGLSSYPTVAELAENLIGCPEYDLDNLFYVDQWPEEFQEEYELVFADIPDFESGDDIPLSHRAKAAAVVVKRFRHFIETGD